MAGTPYELIKELENHYQNVIYIITKLMGLYVQAEYQTSNGRIDILIGTNNYIYIIENLNSMPRHKRLLSRLKTKITHCHLQQKEERLLKLVQMSQ